jgi:hypothetical protein
MKPMMEKRLISNKITDIVFSNIEKILPVNEAFYRSLERLYATSPIIDNFGGLFLLTVCHGKLSIF